MSTKTLTAGIATLSWIDPKTRLPEVDKGGEPSWEVTRQDIKAARLYRFANFLEASITVGGNGSVQKAEFTSDSGMYRGSSALGFKSVMVGKIGRSISQNRSSATFHQIVGCRTESPEKVGKVGGAVGGAVVGAGSSVLAGAEIGALAGSWGGPVGMFVGAAAIGTVGYFVGREVAECVSAFPPIWTELELIIYSDGRLSYSLISHSVFPSNTFYALNTARASIRDPEVYRKQGVSYDGNQVKLKRWKENGWGLVKSQRGAADGNPWGMTNPGKVLGQGKIQRECPVGYSC